MKSLVVYVSVEHGNTKKVAIMISQVLRADLVEAKDFDPQIIHDYDLIGFGSGIFNGKFQAQLLKLVSEIPNSHSKAFIFSTGGYGKTDFHSDLRYELEKKDFQVIGDFSCKGWNTNGPFRLIGGINKGRPDENDLDRARAFAKSLII